MNIIVELTISWSRENMTCIESNQRHQVHQQDHSMNQLILAVEKDSEDEAVEEALAMVKALAMVMDRSLVTTAELYDIMLGTVRALLPHVTIANLMITL